MRGLQTTFSVIFQSSLNWLPRHPGRGVDKCCQGAGGPGLGLYIPVVACPIPLVVPYILASAPWFSCLVNHRLKSTSTQRTCSKNLEYITPAAHEDFSNMLLTQCRVVCVNQIVIYFGTNSPYTLVVCDSQTTPKVRALGFGGLQLQTKGKMFNPNHPKAFKILYMLFYDFGGFRLVECSYHVFTWGLMSQFCLSTKNVPFGYCTV